MSTPIVPEPIARLPWRVLLPLTAMVLFGSAVLYSAAGGSLRPWAATHALRYGVFLAMALTIARVPRDLFKWVAFPMYGALIVLLILVEALGFVGGGSQRWLNLGFMTLQPSELMKPGIVLVLARFYDALPPAMTQSWRSLLPAGALIAVPAALVMLQPDLGTALAISFGGLIVIFLGGLPLRWFIGAGAVTAVAAPIAFFTLLHDYQRRRVTVFMDPEGDPLGAVRRGDPQRVLAIVGTADPFTPPAVVDELESVGVTVVRYQGADHAFVHDPDRPVHNAQYAIDAWARAINWLNG